MKNASVHRFHDKAAVSLPGKGETVYLTAAAARMMGRALLDCAASIAAEPFTLSRFGTVTIPPDMPRSPRRRHTVCERGAAVRLDGYAPARVLDVRRGEDGATVADCIITARGPDWKAGNIGPHGYRTGESVTVRASRAVPRDIIRISRQRCGALWWPAFDIRLTLGAMADGMPEAGGLVADGGAP